MEQELTLRIILEKPPAGVDFALQKGKGSNYEAIQKQRSGTHDLLFEFTARAVAEPKVRIRTCLVPSFRVLPAHASSTST
jgi:hypothetical protein